MLSTRKTKISITLLLFFSFALAFLSGIRTTKADTTIYIRTDGEVDGFLERAGDVYSFTANINGSIVVETDNIVLDGVGHSLTNRDRLTALELVNVNNVTIRNLNLKDCYGIGIFLDKCSNVTVSGNTVTGTNVAFPPLQSTGGIYIWAGNSNKIKENCLADNYIGIVIGYNTERNIVSNNNITNNTRGIVVWEASNNTIYHNNFVKNTVNVLDTGANSSAYYASVNSWDNGSEGNYWSDYTGKDDDGNGLGDIPYNVDENNQDNYPFVNMIPEFTSWIILPLLLTVIVVIIILQQRLPRTSSNCCNYKPRLNASEAFHRLVLIEG